MDQTAIYFKKNTTATVNPEKKQWNFYTRTMCLKKRLFLCIAVAHDDKKMPYLLFLKANRKWSSINHYHQASLSLWYLSSKEVAGWMIVLLRFGFKRYGSICWRKFEVCSTAWSVQISLESKFVSSSKSTGTCLAVVPSVGTGVLQPFDVGIKTDFQSRLQMKFSNGNVDQ